MMPSTRAATHYLQTQIASSTPLERVVMLYDAALRAVEGARDASAQGDRRARKDALSRLLAIIAELQNTLDMERGGAIAADLDRLYDFVLARVMDAITTQQPGPLDDVRRVLMPLRDAWQTIASAPAMAAGATP
jgi:flagellar protein FliS